MILQYMDYSLLRKDQRAALPPLSESRVISKKSGSIRYIRFNQSLPAMIPLLGLAIQYGAIVIFRSRSFHDSSECLSSLLVIDKELFSMPRIQN